MARAEVFAALKAVAWPHRKGLMVTADSADTFALDEKRPYRDKPTTPFVWIRDGKSYVSFHMFPVYVHPDLLKGVPKELMARMQGKSCFNFRAVEPNLFVELGRLVGRARERIG